MMTLLFQFLPLLQKATLFIPAAAIFCYLAYHEVWVPITRFDEDFARYQAIPNKTRKDKIQFWLFGKLPDRRSRAWNVDGDAV